MICLFCQGVLSAQSTQFKKYNNQQYHFSFDLPANWAIIYSKAQDGLICIPLTKQEKEIYSDCYEGIVFRMNIITMALDSALADEGKYTKVGDTYYTHDRINDSVRVKTIKGPNWRGIYHDNVCGISCDGHFHAAAGHCEFIYFSNGKITICIDTNGLEFDVAVLKKLLDQFLDFAYPTEPPVTHCPGR